MIKDIQHSIKNIYDNFPIKEGPNRIEVQGRMIQLVLDEVGWMGTMKSELDVILQFDDKAAGDVLITGFGLGISVLIHAGNVRVDTITVIENNQFVLNQIVPYLRTQTQADFEVLVGNADTPEIIPGLREYDAIWLDHYLNRPDEDKINRQKKLYRPYLKNSESLIDCWK